MVPRQSRRERIFNEKFADPTYHGALQVRHNSTLAGAFYGRATTTSLYATAMHISAASLERYSIGSIENTGQVAAIEAHLGICAWCAGYAVGAQNHVYLMRAAAIVNQ